MRRQGIRHPARLVPLAFLATIMLGTAVLMLPIARADEGAAPFLTALFTAVSATCVTGLAVVDTATYWSGFGQTVILLLFQIGGFGMMTGATLLAMLVADRVRLGTQLALQAETRSVGLGDTGAVLRLIVAITLAVEALIALVLTLRLRFHYGEDWGAAAWNGVFHAISAFNNAGFSTYSAGLVPFQSDALFLTAVMLAIVVGGLGFPVLHEIRMRRRAWRRWSVHTKITIFGTALLILLGALLMGVYEWDDPATLGAMSVGDRVLNAVFLSVSARTAGFNAVDIGALRTESLVLHYFLMFIGAGSAGTAGGIKLTTFFLLGFAVWAEIRGSNDTVAFGRRICPRILRQALTVVLLGASAVALGTLALTGVTDLPLERVAFEAVSAFATVGLSTGITAQLPPSGQWILILLMYVGRVGTITVATAIALHGRHTLFRYPEERPIVG